MIINKVIAFAVMFFALAVSVCAQDEGNATYYSNRLHGNRTSDGTRYHRDSMTCAHKTYPLGTLLRVKSKRSGNEVYVKVTDRGPFRRGCIVDLSYAAARQLDMIAAGIEPVEIEKIEPLIPFRDIENTMLPTLDLQAAAGKNVLSLAHKDKTMEKELKNKVSTMMAFDFNLDADATKQKEEPRYRIHRDQLSAQSKKQGSPAF